MDEVKILNSSEKLVTRKLWEEIFTEDSKGFLDYYYKYKCRDNLVYAIKRDDRLVSMLQRNPYVMKVNGTELAVDYIVGVATDKNCRHQGLMAKLLKTALKDMAKQGRAFTFLMPAAEAIYRPFGFRFVYSQPVYKEVIGSSEEASAGEAAGGQYIVVPLTSELFNKFSGQVNRHLEQNYDVFTVRTREYFEDLTKQYESDGGKVSCVLAENRIAGWFSWWLADEGVEITEILCFENDRTEVIKCIKDYFRKTYHVNKLVIRGEVSETCERESRIMLRITNVLRMLELVRSDKELKIKLWIKDSLIPENNKAYYWCVSDKYSDVREIDSGLVNAGEEYSLIAASYGGEDFDCEAIMDIEELALWLFNGELSEGNQDLKHIRTVSRVFINEIV